MRDASFNLEALENKINKQATTMEGKFKNYITAQTESIKPIINQHYLEAETKLKTASENLISSFQLKV